MKGFRSLLMMESQYLGSNSNSFFFFLADSLITENSFNLCRLNFFNYKPEEILFLLPQSNSNMWILNSILNMWIQYSHIWISRVFHFSSLQHSPYHFFSDPPLYPLNWRISPHTGYIQSISHLWYKQSV